MLKTLTTFTIVAGVLVGLAGTACGDYTSEDTTSRLRQCAKRALDTYEACRSVNPGIKGVVECGRDAYGDFGDCINEASGSAARNLERLTD